MHIILTRCAAHLHWNETGSIQRTQYRQQDDLLSTDTWFYDATVGNKSTGKYIDQGR